MYLSSYFLNNNSATFFFPLFRQPEEIRPGTPAIVVAPLTLSHPYVD